MLAIKHVFTTLKTVITWGGIEATSQHVLNVQSMIMNNAVMPLPCGGTESARRLLYYYCSEEVRRHNRLGRDLMAEPPPPPPPGQCPPPGGVRRLRAAAGFIISLGTPSGRYE